MESYQNCQVGTCGSVLGMRRDTLQTCGIVKAVQLALDMSIAKVGC